MRAAIYSRVSHEEQVEGWSLDAQHELCMALVHSVTGRSRRSTFTTSRDVRRQRTPGPPSSA